MISDVKIGTLSEKAVIATFGNVIDYKSNILAISTKDYLENNAFVGMEEVVVAYNSITVFYEPLQVLQFYKPLYSVHQWVKDFIENLAFEALKKIKRQKESQLIKIPVAYGHEDLEALSDVLNLTTKEIVEVHTGVDYQVFMIGFLPGFPYLGILPSILETKRKSIPNPKVSTGSVAIAGLQSGIYPSESPGGWHILGKTHISMYNIHNNPRCFLQTGDRVRFVDVHNSQAN